MFLIMSAAYVDLELQSEFGALPPSFLPLGNRRLFQHQNNIIPKDYEKYISLPESYQLSNLDKKWLDDNKLTVISVPDGLSLGASLVATLSLIDIAPDDYLHLMFGDTLFTELPTGVDIIALSEVEDSYNWATIDDNSNSELHLSHQNLSQQNRQVICGYFSFSKPRLLIKNITQSHWDFFSGLKRYNEHTKLHAVNSDKWLDFGHVNTYYRSKAKFTTQRAFNELIITTEYIEKSSENNNKIIAEANWFCELPYELKNYTPQFMGSLNTNGKFKYRLEYLHHTALNELYVFSKLPPIVWKNIFNSCIKFIKNCSNYSINKEKNSSPLKQLFTEKTKQRLDIYCRENEIDIHETWNYNERKITIYDIIHLSEEHLPKIENSSTIIHGDYCFSNILYDFRTHRIKVIDPRGIDNNGEKTIYGDINYDIAKLCHSVLGMYDWIIAGYYEIHISNRDITFNIKNEQKEIQELFIKIITDEFNLSIKNLYAMQLHLFLSMLPLHSDDKNRQNALFANAFRLYTLLLENINDNNTNGGNEL
ncbi:hypothetical protein [Providencia alcalifaciens]|uniref:hypothetical protein n=1 Tax=Providencia alcalifaciens TaxID=126385 RepID=UPI0003E23D35|nr:hypothetical protein [Providencia alcalifaciens]ETT01220.1 hypothetical protein HMPREF1568_3389 [Providencia alcalifaciens PAL-3]EUC98948.1 hypothetical protein HMPREF1566_0785 [Providencia alcalifaciens PAL-1]